MRVLVACERSGVVRRAFRAAGHDAYSCDLAPADDGNGAWHYQCDVRDVINVHHWDLLIAHPPCTYLTNSGVRWLTTIPARPRADVLYGEDRRRAMIDACAFFAALYHAPVARVCIENPIMHGHARAQLQALDVPTYSQIVHPWQFGHGETKATALWLRGLPALQATEIVAGRDARIHRMPPSAERTRLRSETYEGIARAMAEQWSNL